MQIYRPWQLLRTQQEIRQRRRLRFLTAWGVLLGTLGVIVGIFRLWGKY